MTGNFAFIKICPKCGTRENWSGPVLDLGKTLELKYACVHCGSHEAVLKIDRTSPLNFNIKNLVLSREEFDKILEEEGIDSQKTKDVFWENTQEVKKNYDNIYIDESLREIAQWFKKFFPERC